MDQVVDGESFASFSSEIQSPPISGRLTASTNLPPFDQSPPLSPVDASFTPFECDILRRLGRLEEALSKFRLSVGDSLTAIDNDLCRLENRVTDLEQSHSGLGRTQSQTAALNLVNFNCTGTIGNLPGCVLAIATFRAEWLFIATDGGMLEVWDIGDQPEHVQSLLLASIDDSPAVAPLLSAISATTLAVVTPLQPRVNLFAGISDGRLAVFEINSKSETADVVPLKLCQVWPKNDLHSSSGSNSVHCMALSSDQVVLAVGRDHELSIATIDSQCACIDSDVFIHSFFVEQAEECRQQFDTLSPQQSAQQQKSITNPGSADSKRQSNVQQDQYKVNALMFDEDSMFLFCAVGYRCISVFAKQCRESHITWRREPRSITVPFEIDLILITSLVMAAGNRRILAGASNGKLLIFERETERHYRRSSPTSTYKFLHSLHGVHTAAINCVVAIGTNYPLCVLTGSADATIHVWHWHANDREMIPVQALDRHKNDITGLVIAQNSNNNNDYRLFSASNDKSVRVWVPTTSPRQSLGDSSYTTEGDGNEEEQYEDGDSL